MLRLEGPDRQVAYLKPYVASIPINLWGRDLLEQWGAFLSIPSIAEQSKKMMLPMGYHPGQGLWKNNKGITEPIVLSNNPGRQSLRFPNLE